MDKYKISGAVMEKIYENILKLYNKKQTFYTKTLLNGNIGEKTIIAANDLKEIGIDISKEKLPQIVKDQDNSYFIESINDIPTVVIVGGGHVAVAIAKLAEFLEFNTVVIDDRAEFVSLERFPYSQRIAERVDRALQQDFGDNAYYVIVTRGHKDDFRAVLAVLQKKYYRYLGMIGSKQKVGIIRQKLHDKGYENTQIDNIHAPIGLPIGAITVEEIAVSILAEIIAIKSAFVGDRTQNNVFAALEEIVVGKIQEKAVVATIIEKHGSSPRGVGSKMLVTQSGKIFGTIGGGAVEYAAQKRAVQIIAEKTAVIEEYDLSPQDASKLGMICGGRVKVLFELVN
ncbi:xanthine dehydrogenase accessory factor [Pectinatus brassicae]|uniref:Xanthine dehydrogenase accessory factor n=3 Tax=Pectinatus brassicae TaxID=862415 RepID=A0A840UMW9_9FIRM|nr:xanthine dehydrogenase accessory factor [Pectinatus brassicae]